MRPEPWPEMNAFTAAGGLWSTLSDLARWANFPTVGAEGVLAKDTLDEMCRPEIMADLEAWTLAWGLGLCLYRSGDRILAGHGGAMPGYLSGLAVHRGERTGAIVLSNASSQVQARGLAVELACRVLDGDPQPGEAWRPGPAVPAELAILVGVWWSEGSPFTFSVRDGRLEARVENAPDGKPPAVFDRIGDDRYRTTSGREQGELLRVERDEDGAVARMHWAGYPFTRTPETFGAVGIAPSASERGAERSQR